jgi:RNA polymerase sigma-70 factor (ECF subfamily)
MICATATAGPRRPQLKEADHWAKDPEVQLMHAVRRGDKAAFDELVALYWLRIFGRFYRKLGDRQEAEDLTQEVFLRLYRYRHRYSARASFATWIYHITQNVLRNALRSRRRHARVKLSIFDDFDSSCCPESLLRDDDSPSRPIERAETAVLVRDAVSGLLGRQRQAIEMHQFQHQSYAQIAERMDVTPKAAKSLLYRARTQLRQDLQERLVEIR